MRRRIIVSKILAEILRVAKFGLVGGISALVYAVSLFFLVKNFDMGSMQSSAVAYVIAIPASFVGQKYFTFKSPESIWRELPAFLALQAINLFSAMLVTYTVVDVLGLNHFVGVLAVIMTIAIISYCSMALSIFRKPISRSSMNGGDNLP